MIQACFWVFNPNLDFIPSKDTIIFLVVVQNFNHAAKCKLFWTHIICTSGVTRCFSPKKIPAIFHDVIDAVLIFFPYLGDFLL